MTGRNYEATIRALLTLAADPAASPGERENATARAAQMMSRHGIQAEQAGTPDHDTGATVWPYAVAGSDGLGEARAKAAARIARAMGCQTVTQTYGSNAAAVVAVVGVHADIAALQRLLPLIITQADLGTATAAANGHRAHSYRASFLRGFGDRVAERIKAARRDHLATDNRAAVVVANRDKAISELYDERFGGIARPDHDGPQRRDGYAAGQRAANSADIGGSRLGPTAGHAVTDR